ncbi:MFS transporter [Demequina sediminicola]|uniref:MFS transporter n=1 Tax=Demequina sediminicola TaxID=1095026 RepID=UPI0007831E53|nr:MFS transporter [Demequina sediminicola]
MDTSTPPRPTPPTLEQAHARVIRIALVFAILAGTLGVAVANIALPAIALDFTLPASGAQWVVTAYLVAMTAATIVVGRLGDIWGDTRVLSGGLTLLALGAVAAALAPSFAILLTARAVQGVGAAVALVLSIAIAKRVAPDGKTGAYLGALGATSALAQVMGPSVGGLLVDIGNWRSTMWLLAGLTAVAVSLTARIPSQSASTGAKRTPTRLNAASAIALVTATASAVLALSFIATWHWTIVLALTLAAAAAATFAWRSDSRAATHGRLPVLPRTLLTHVKFRTTLTMNALVSGAMMTMLIIPPYFLMGEGLTATQAGLVMAAGPALGALTGIYAGRLVDSWGAAPMRSLGTAMVATGCAGIAILTPLWGWWGLLIPMAALTPGFQAFMAANTALAMVAAGDDRGSGAGTLTLARNLGQALATAVTTGLMATVMAVAPVQSGSAVVVAVCFGAAAALAGVALLSPLAHRGISYVNLSVGDSR